MAYQDQAQVNAELFLDWVDIVAGLPAGVPIPSKHSIGWSVESLPKGIYVVDIETCQVSKDYWVPFCAVIYDCQTGTYHYYLAQDPKPFLELPIEDGSLLIGHGICGYDRRFFANEYSLGGYQYLDTMGLATRVLGISNQQVPLHKLLAESDSPSYWVKAFPGLSLAALYQHYFDEPLDKTTRDVMTSKPWAWYWENQDQIISYCAHDVRASYKLFQVLWSEAKSRFHPRSIHASTLLSQTKLTLNLRDYREMTAVNDDYYTSLLTEIEDVLKSYLAKAKTRYVDPWLLDPSVLGTYPSSYKSLDWTPSKAGLPAWYNTAKHQKLTLNKRISAIILEVTYKGDLVYYKTTGSKGSWVTDSQTIPHPKGKGNLGSIFCKDHWALLGSVFSVNPEVLPTISRIKEAQFWKAFQSRIKEVERFTYKGVHIPEYQPWGTISGRGTDPLWLVSPAPKPDLPGSELRTMVQSPDGYKIVGADFASQEMRLFALIGDSFKGRIGSSELSRLLIAGEDIHTALSVKSGAPRQICKNINYGAVYGLGLASAEVYCSLAGMQNPRSRAKEILSSLKGTKSGSVLSGGLASLPFNALARLIADPFNTVSPILGNKLTKGLGTSDFATSRQNWIVQTSGCDLRDLLVTTLHAMDSSYRILLYVHDEPRYLVPEGQVDQFVKDLQQAHLETMTYVFEALGIDDQVPEPYQYFDGVEIDSYWRKDAKDPCVTPTRPIGLSPGTEITRPTV